MQNSSAKKFTERIGEPPLKTIFTVIAGVLLFLMFIYTVRHFFYLDNSGLHFISLDILSLLSYFFDLAVVAMILVCCIMTKNRNVFLGVVFVLFALSFLMDIISTAPSAVSSIQNIQYNIGGFLFMVYCLIMRVILFFAFSALAVLAFVNNLKLMKAAKIIAICVLALNIFYQFTLFCNFFMHIADYFSAWYLTISLLFIFLYHFLAFSNLVMVLLLSLNILRETTELPAQQDNNYQNGYNNYQDKYNSYY